MYSHQPIHNIVRDYNKAQGVTHPTDLSIQIIRDYNIRYITVQNSATRPMSYAITTYDSGPVPDVLETLNPGEIKNLGINTHGGPPQYIWLLDEKTKRPVGAPDCIRSNAQDLVIRDGLNKAWIHFFSRPSFSPGF